MTPERLAEIKARVDDRCGFTPADATDLLAEVERLTDQCKTLEAERNAALSAYTAEHVSVTDALAACEKERDEARDMHAKHDADRLDQMLALAASEARVKRMREALRPHACHVDEMSYHGEAMVCDLCGSRWNNGAKHNEPPTPETHNAGCALAETED